MEIPSERNKEAVDKLDVQTSSETVFEAESRLLAVPTLPHRLANQIYGNRMRDEDEYYTHGYVLETSPDFTAKNIAIVMACSAIGGVAGYALGETTLPQIASSFGPKALIFGSGVMAGWVAGLTITTGSRWIRG